MQDQIPGVGDPEEIPPPTPGTPTEPPVEDPPGNPLPEVPTPINDPVEPDWPRELPPDSPDEAPDPGRRGPRTPPVNEAASVDSPRSDAGVTPGATQFPLAAM